MAWANAQDILKLRNTIIDCLMTPKLSVDRYELESDDKVKQIILKPNPHQNVKMIITLEDKSLSLIDVKVNAYKMNKFEEEVLDSMVITNSDLGLSITLDIQMACKTFLRSKTYVGVVNTSYANSQTSKLSDLLNLL